MRCPECAETIPPGSAECPLCAAPIAEAVTSLDTGATVSAVPPSEPSPHGRFLPGATVADRYRIVGLLGRGGMGEVYRADDLKLGQQVALKFLPDSMVADDDRVRRLFDEVREARKVSHPNVCRVFDVGEAEGQHYVSMEYVDGEDLSSLLRRIGRLPHDKAVEIARQLCAALAAAHDEGVVHRDLKPANIMLDGRGRVKLTDFGLAAAPEVRAGTPIYMAPEQLAGTEVSIRSDIYSLGIVIYELFTGKRVFEADDMQELARLHDSVKTTSMTRASQLDPAIERIIERCLQKDPEKRPQSALAVAASLPGADPLAAALAAGETPSPEMVAEAGGHGRLRAAIAAPLLLFVIGGAIAVGALQSSRSLVGWTPFQRSPAQLDARAVEVLEDLGYATDFADTASGFAVDSSYLRWLRQNGTGDAQSDLIASGRSASITRWWRGSPTALVWGGSTGGGLSSGVTLSDPPRTTPGMVALQLDTTGRLVWLDANPGRIVEALADRPSTDWARLFELMDLDIASFEPVAPQLSPDHFADERAAWVGSLPEDPQAELRLEAAALRGRPIALRTFTVARPLRTETALPAASSSAVASISAVLIVLAAVVMILTVIFGGLYVARRNLASGRGDARGARRLGFAVAAAIASAWLLAEHTFTPNDINFFFEMLTFVAATGGLIWALYLAVEPFMRRHAPEALIGWTRFLDGRWADPLVARDLLLGCAAGVLSRLLDVLPMTAATRIEMVENGSALPYASLTELFGALASTATGYVLLGLGMSFLYALSFLFLKRRFWLVYGGWLLFFGGIGFIPGLTINSSRPATTLLSSTFWALSWALWLYVLFRLGLLVFVVMSTTGAMLASALLTLDLAAWYAPSMLAILALLATLAGYAFYRCVEWKGGLADALGGD